MKIITLPSGEYLLVEVPEEASDIQMHKTQGLDEYLITYHSDLGTTKAYFPPGQWKIIGKGSELSEDSWKGIVKETKGGFFGHIKGFKDYNPIYPSMDKPPLKTAKESGYSLLATHFMKPETTLTLRKVTP